MLFFRSEERVREWCAARGSPVRPLVTIDQLWGLAQAWYASRLAPPRPIVMVGPAYALLRDDRRLLVGATVERAGFASLPTPAGQAWLEAQAGHLSKRVSDLYKHISERAARKAADELARVKTEARAEAPEDPSPESRSPSRRVRLDSSHWTCLRRHCPRR